METECPIDKVLLHNYYGCTIGHFHWKKKVTKNNFQIGIYTYLAVMTVEIKNLFKIDKFCFAICLLCTSDVPCIVFYNKATSKKAQYFAQYNSIQTKNLNLISVGNY